MSDYPIHDELKSRAAEREIVQEVIDTLDEKGITLCRWTSDAVGYVPIVERQGALVAMLMGIDHDAFLAERERLLLSLSGGSDVQG